MCRVVWVGGREGAWWLPTVGIRASQGTLFLLYIKINLIRGNFKLSPMFQISQISKKKFMF